MTSTSFAVISGSTRVKSQSAKVAQFVSALLEKQSIAPQAIHHIDFAKEHFPLWDELIWEKGVDWHKGWASISKKLHASDGIIIVAPEWSGMIPSQLINFFQLCSHRELAHKPALIVGISAATGGAYPVAQLRMNSAKNTQICYIPEHVIIRDVNNVLNHGTETLSEADTYIRHRLEHALSLLNLYTTALKPMREHHLIQQPPFPFGM